MVQIRMDQIIWSGFMRVHGFTLMVEQHNHRPIHRVSFGQLGADTTPTPRDTNYDAEFTNEFLILEN